MYTVRYGGRKGRKVSLDVSRDLVAVRSLSRGAIADPTRPDRIPLSAEARAILAGYEVDLRFPDAGVEVLRPAARRIGSRATASRDRARKVLKREKALEFAGRVLVDRTSKSPVLYTENLFVKFDDDTGPRACRALLKRFRLAVKQQLPFARNAFFVGAKQGIGTEVFGLAERLLDHDEVELCHPELVRRVRARAAFARQWHLQRTTIDGAAVDAHANVVSAWALSQGENVTIAVIDTGIDIDHEEFRSAAKIVAPRDATRGTDNPRPGSGENHGTACAGVACGDGNFAASGVAPRARLMPIRLMSGLGSMAEANAFRWAAQNGADVISCSWGPEDGDFTDPADPVHDERVALPDSTRLAIDDAVRNGRGGRGCVVLFAAGNGNESVDNDGYAANPQVIAVAACNDRGKKSAYSDFGAAVWCAFPSNHGFASLTTGIWTTDRSGNAGYNPGDQRLGDAAGNYANDFGGTSSACPGAAGVAALVLARNPQLRGDELRDILKRCCDQIDRPGGNYDASGRSPLYGFGRLNARRAVELAVPADAGDVVTATAIRNVAIRDLKTARATLRVGETDPLIEVRVTVGIEHTFIGDLVVQIKPPAATAVDAITLHDREGRGTQNLNRTYDAASTPALAALRGKPPAGTWTLIVSDREQADTGHIRMLSLEMRV